ncbi:hypothetical protein TNCV_3109751 [Trichonephila clavipes]|nr:hypothetical protein TNCV_3109751 [Trichonephila clavipes]
MCAPFLEEDPSCRSVRTRFTGASPTANSILDRWTPVSIIFSLVHYIVAKTPRSKATRGLLGMDLVILNPDQVMRTNHELLLPSRLLYHANGRTLSQDKLNTHHLQCSNPLYKTRHESTTMAPQLQRSLTTVKSLPHKKILIK